MYSSANDIQFYPIGRDIPENETSKYKKSILWSRSGESGTTTGHADRHMKPYAGLRPKWRLSIKKRLKERFFNEMALKLTSRLKLHSERTAFTKLIMKLKQFWNMSSFSDMLQLILGNFNAKFKFLIIFQSGVRLLTLLAGDVVWFSHWFPKYL